MTKLDQFFNKPEDVVTRFYIIFCVKVFSNGVSLLAILCTFRYMIHQKIAKNKKILNSTRDLLIFIILFFIIIYSLGELYFPNDIQHCVFPKVAQNISQQMIMILLFVLLRLVHSVLNKQKLSKIFWWFCGFFSIGMIVTNIFLLTKEMNKTFILLEHKMQCEVINYISKKELTFTLIFFPTMILTIYAIFVLIKGNRYLKNFPEKTTKILRQEIVYFPYFIIFSYTPKLLKHYRRFFYDVDQDLFMIFILEKFCFGIMGFFVCFAFIWKRKGFNPKVFFQRKQKFEPVTKEDLENFNYFNQ